MRTSIINLNAILKNRIILPHINFLASAHQEANANETEVNIPIPDDLYIQSFLKKIIPYQSLEPLSLQRKIQDNVA